MNNKQFSAGDTWNLLLSWLRFKPVLLNGSTTTALPLVQKGGQTAPSPRPEPQPSQEKPQVKSSISTMENEAIAEAARREAYIPKRRDDDQLPPHLKQEYASRMRVVDSTTSEYSALYAKCHSRKKNAEDNLNHSSRSELIKQKGDILEPERRRAIAEAVQPLEKENATITADIHTRNARLRSLSGRVTERRDRGEVFSKSHWDMKGLLIGFFVIIGIFEIPVFQAGLLQLAEIPDIWTYGVAAVLSIINAFVTHSIGYFWADRRRIVAGIFFAIGTALTIILFILRCYAEASLLVSFLAIALYGLGIMIAYNFRMRHIHVQEDREYTRLTKANQEDIITRDNNEKTIDRETLRITTEYTNKAIELADKEIQEQKRIIENCDIQIITLRQECKSKLLAIKDTWYDVYYTYVKTLKRCLNEQGLPDPKLSKMDPPALKLGLEDLENPKPGGANGILSTLICMILFFMTGCSSSPTHHVTFLYDQTDAMHTQMNVSDYIASDVLGADEAGMIDEGIILTVSAIADKVLIPNCETVIDPSPGPLLKVTKTRLADLESFWSQANSCIQNISVAGEKKRSLIAERITAMIMEMKKSKADTMTLILASDMLHHSDIWSFYSKRKLQYKTFQSIMDQHCDPGRLEGLRMVIVHESTASSDRIVRCAQDFFTRYYTEKGANVDILANL